MRSSASGLVRHELDVAHGGERLRLRGLVGDARAAGDPPVLLMVHGSTYPSAATFALPVEGRSMAEALADAGIDVWTIDLIGYGGSSRPAAMALSPGEGDPVTSTSDAVEQVASAITHLQERYGRARIALLGWSWGTAVCGAYAAANPTVVERLVQIAPLWLRDGPSATDPGGRLGAYRVVDVGRIADRWLAGVPGAAREDLIPAGTVEALADALLASDPGWSSSHPAQVRAPNGTVADTRAFWAAGRPLYDAGAIRCPVLVVAGEWDREWPLAIARSYLAALTGSASRELVVVSAATHSLILESARSVVYDAVMKFIAEGAKTVAAHPDA